MANEMELRKKANEIVGQAHKTVSQQLQKGSLDIPENYSVNNALQAAAIELQQATDKRGRPILEVATEHSIKKALQQMVQAGLNPAKDQVDFIAYGNKAYAQPRYFGNIALAKRLGAIHVLGEAVYEEDEFSYSKQANGLTVIEKHEQSLQSKQSKLIGAYSSIIFEDRPALIEVMTIEEIKDAWEQGNYSRDQKPGKTPHDKFSGEMAKKTVINRNCKTFIKSSDDANLAMQEVVQGETRHEEEVEQEKEEKMGSGDFIDVTPNEPEEEEQEKPEEAEADPEPEADQEEEDEPAEVNPGQMRMGEEDFEVPFGQGVEDE